MLRIIMCGIYAHGRIRLYHWIIKYRDIINATRNFAWKTVVYDEECLSDDSLKLVSYFRINMNLF
jgi:hypothetical protein